MFEGYQSKKFNWVSPLIVARRLFAREEYCAFLYSSMNESNLGNYSYLSFDVDRHVKGDDFLDLDLIDDEQWFGYLGYGLKNKIETLPLDEKYKISLPDLWFIKYNNIIRFNHEEKIINVFYKNFFDDKIIKDEEVPTLSLSNFTHTEIISNMSKEDYLKKVKEIQDMIKEGVIYQANLTRKFNGTFTNKIDYYDIFEKLCKINPSNYSCYLKYKEVHIISSSPEQFLSVDDQKNAETRPIKGTIRRFSNYAKDQEQIKSLYNSSKDRAENLMIVDLMRNDFSRNCIAETVKVNELFKVSTYSTLHHLSSTIIGKIKEQVSNIDFIKYCFPPGSMTGTPKIKAIEICSRMERFARGLYSGCIGRISKNKSLELSVIIRTLIIKDKEFEFQVGGAIVYDSDPVKEWEETLIKAKGIAKALGINIKSLKGI